MEDRDFLVSAGVLLGAWPRRVLRRPHSSLGSSMAPYGDQSRVSGHEFAQSRSKYSVGRPLPRHDLYLRFNWPHHSLEKSPSHSCSLKGDKSDQKTMNTVLSKKDSHL
jgi:hypothetical protein